MNSLIAGWNSGAALLLAGRVVQLLNSFLLSVIVVRRFGLDVMGTFAIGFIAATILTCIVQLGLPSSLPRARQSHARSCYAAICLQLAALLLLLPIVGVYARIQANTSDQFVVIVLVTLGGALIGVSNTGLMLSIMRNCFYPGFVAPTCEMIALLIGAFVARNAIQLAAFTFSGRLTGLIIIWSVFSFQRISLRRCSCIAQRSVRYFVPDALALLSEQSAPLMLTALISHSELAIFRLCQQVLNAADTPGWTFVQSKYPKLVTATGAFIEETKVQVGRLGWLAAAICCIGSTILAFYVYHVPIMARMMCYLSITLFWRYRNNFFDQALRASGRVGTSMRLAIAKAVVSFAIFLPLASILRLWGSVLALGVLSVASGVAYKEVFYRKLPQCRLIAGGQTNDY